MPGYRRYDGFSAKGGGYIPKILASAKEKLSISLMSVKHLLISLLMYPIMLVLVPSVQAADAKESKAVLKAPWGHRAIRRAWI